MRRGSAVGNQWRMSRSYRDLVRAYAGMTIFARLSCLFSCANVTLLSGCKGAGAGTPSYPSQTQLLPCASRIASRLP